MKLIYGLLVVVMISSSCGNNPKVIAPSSQASNQNSENSTGIFSENSNEAQTVQETTTKQSVSQDLHTVVVKEILPTEKYVYLFVEEGDEEYWIATGKQPVEIGNQYFYRGGLLKTNFESKEYGRTFDKVYLVSKLISTNHADHNDNSEASKGENNKDIKPASTKEKIVHVAGYTKIADLVSNPEKYQGTEVLLTGTCVKVNPNIMGRNWIHLQDGTMDDYDLVVTSNIPVPEGHTVKLKGVVSLDKDFGAGYRYDILVENAQLILDK